MSKVHDISMSIFPGMTVYKDNPKKQPILEVVQDFPAASARETRLHIDAHTGTHVDAPLHMIPGGDTMESIHIERLVGTCRVLDLTQVENGITRRDLEPFSIQKGEKILLKTSNSSASESDAFDLNFIYLEASGAQYLAEIGIDLVGIDALGIERSQPLHETHVELFSRDIIIMEGLRLASIAPGSYLLVAAPLKLIGTEAAPARVLLIEE